MTKIHSRRTGNVKVSSGKEQEKYTNDKNDEDFIHETENYQCPTSGQEKLEEANIKKYLCPISSCTFFLCEKNSKSELVHLKTNHQHVQDQMSFLVLE